jgi:hypothetical protein
LLVAQVVVVEQGMAVAVVVLVDSVMVISQ